jgi:hypothetical protein
MAASGVGLACDFERAAAFRRCCIELGCSQVIAQEIEGAILRFEGDLPVQCIAGKGLQGSAKAFSNKSSFAYVKGSS